MRKLTLICISFSLSVFLCNYLLNEYIETVLLTLFVVSGTVIAVKGRSNIKKKAVSLALLSFACGIASYSAAVLIKKAPASTLDGRTVNVTGKVISFPEDYSSYSRVNIILKTKEGYSCNAVLYDSDGLISGLRPGYVVNFLASVNSADTRYGKDYDRYNAKDIYLTANIESDFKIEEHRCVNIRILAAYVAESISDIIDNIFPEDTAPFMKSLLLGDKTDFYSDDEHYVALNKAGLMHIVAVSGMHVAFVVTLIQLLFGSGRTSSLICIILVWCFVFISGASPSAVRAGIMQTILLLAPFLRRENDPVTALSFALAVILLFNPFACASISLQLSFAAMAGLVLFAERIRNSFKINLMSKVLSDIANFFTDVFSASISVMIFSLPLTAIHFGTVSVLSPLSNILALWSVSFCFGGGYLAVVVGSIIFPAGKFIALAVSLIARYIFFVSSLISSFKYSVVYTDDILVVLWLVLTYALSGLCIFSRENNGIKILSVIGFSAIALGAFLAETAMYYSRSPGFFSAVDVGQGQCICAISGDRTVLVDCGTANYGLGNAGDKAVAYLRSRGRTQVDYLIITHFHADHVNGVERLINSFPVKNIVYSDSLCDDEGYYEEIFAAAKARSVNLIPLKEDSLLTAGNISVSLFVPDSDASENENCIFALISSDGYDMLITGDAPKSIEKKFIENNSLSNIEVLIVGHHGSRYSSSGELLGQLGGDIAIISVGYNLYGHPTGETLERLSAYGYTDIYRTDLNGTVEIPIGFGD